MSNDLQTQNRNEESYFSRYYKMAVRFQIIGTVLLVISIGLNMYFGHSNIWFHVFLTAPGVILLVWGGSSSRPHNLIKSFAMQCMNTPTDEFAQGLLDAITHQKRVSLTNASIHTVYNAIAAYSELEDANSELANTLKREADDRIKKRIF